MKGTTKTNTLTTRQVKKVVQFALSYCEMTFGKNNRKKSTLEVSIMDKVEGSKKTCGWYDPIENKITLFLKPNKTVKDLCSTLIHEYTHYKQPCRTKYRKLLNEHGYENHPFEIQAYSTEKYYTPMLMKILRLTQKVK